MSVWTGLWNVARSFPWHDRSDREPWTERSHLRVRDVRLMGAMGMPSVDAPLKPSGERGRTAAAVADARAAAEEQADAEGAADQPNWDSTADENADEGAYR